MSQENTRADIKKVKAVKYQSNASVIDFYSVLNNLTKTYIDKKLSFSFTNNIKNCSAEFTKNNLVQDTVQSPNKIRRQFAEEFNANLKKTDAKKSSALETKKEILINTIAKLPYNICNKDIILKKTTEILKSSEKELKKNVTNLVSELQTQHTKIFVNELSDAVKNASCDVGFKNITVKVKNSTPVILAVNETGQAIISEIRIDDNTKLINLVSETTGIQDNSCDKIMQNFDVALKNYGIEYGSIDKKRTAKQYRMQTIDNDNQKQIERTRKLNKNHKLKH